MKTQLNLNQIITSLLSHHLNDSYIIAANCNDFVRRNNLDIARRNALLQSLAGTIVGYRDSEIPVITSSHVEKWLDQFDMDDQPVILSEIDAIMKRFYFSKARVKECLRRFIKEDVIGNKLPWSVLSRVRFLNVQKEGSSQGAMLQIVDEILQEDYEYSIAWSGVEDVHTFIYIDDGLYTGNRLRYDLTEGVDTHTPAWIQNEALPNCTLMIYTIVGHLAGINYSLRHINEAANRKGIIVKRKHTLIVDNKRYQSDKVEFLWPEDIAGDSNVDTYVANLRANLARRNWPNRDLFRSNNVPYQERLFSSRDARTVVERAFLKKGVKIVSACQNPAESVRPLGFEKIGSLGFGTFYVTYRNIANNCPLVLWWGDPQYSATYPLGMWYPLFPRRTNSQNRSFVNDTMLDDQPF